LSQCSLQISPWREIVPSHLRAGEFSPDTLEQKQVFSLDQQPAGCNAVSVPALAQVRHRREEERIEVVGHGYIGLFDPGFIASREVIEPAGMIGLRNALLHFEEWIGYSGQLFIVDESNSEIDEEILYEPDVFELRDEQLLSRVSVFFAEEDEVDEGLIRSVLTPTLERGRMRLIEVSIDPHNRGYSVDLTLEVPLHRQSVAQTLHRCREVETQVGWALVGNGELHANAAASVIRAGHPALLIDIYENEWLDAKRVPYQLDHERGRYELAKDVAAFANGVGGLILIGAKTKSTPDGDQIRKINECRRGDVSPASYRSVVSKQVYPPPEGLAFDWVPLTSADSGVFLIEIPEQKAANRPFLVSGLHSGDRITELGFTLPSRDGAGTTAPRIDQIHTRIRAGMASLRGEAVGEDGP
jgi:Putative DNA-binding domain